MKTHCAVTRKSRGFTLLEVIVTIIVAGIMASVLLPFSQTMLRASAESVTVAADLARARSILENITSDHIYQLVSSNTPLAALKSRVSAGASDAGIYGEEYILLHNDFTGFNLNTRNEAPSLATGNLLKVSIRVGQARLTAIFGE